MPAKRAGVRIQQWQAPGRLGRQANMVTDNEYRDAVVKAYNMGSWPRAPERRAYPLPLLPD